ncbi:MAG: 30S ribosomal protein S2 [Chloroflexi bacterium]|nr:30S ribosomal protein S2 [Chloroflexota bacterium]
MPPIVSLKTLLESGVHFGHRVNRRHPKMAPYIFTARNGIHIINLQLTQKALREAYNLIRDTVAKGGTVLFVGTKRQAQDIIAQEATRAGMPYVNYKWLGGMLTNWRTISQRIRYLEELERMRDSGELERLTKKEALMILRKIERLKARLSGIRTMTRLPDIVFVVDVCREETAIKEANRLNIPVVAMVDTNCDPTNVDYVIPSNDDAIRAIKLIVGLMADAVIEGKRLWEKEMAEKAQAVAEEAPEPVAEEAEIEDEALLGESTLAKIRAQQAQAEGQTAAPAEAEAPMAEAEAGEAAPDVAEASEAS